VSISYIPNNQKAGKGSRRDIRRWVSFSFIREFGKKKIRFLRKRRVRSIKGR